MSDTDTMNGKPYDFIYRTEKRMVAIWMRPGQCLSMNSKDINIDERVEKFKVYTKEQYESLN